MFKKESKRKRLKGFVDYGAYYPDLDMFRTREGFTKAWYLGDADAFSRDDYKDYVLSLIVVPDKGSIQVCHLAGKDVSIITVPAETPEEAEEMFADLPVSGKPVPIREWIDLISQTSLFADFEDKEKIGAVDKKGRPAAAIVSELQPYASAKKAVKRKNRVIDLMSQEANDEYVRTVILSNFPAYVYPSMTTEIIRLSDTISTSLFLRKVDKEKCVYALDNFKVQLSELRIRKMKETLSGDEDLYHACLLISVHDKTRDGAGRLIDSIREVAERYMVDINVMEHQQYAAWRSMLPLGVCHIRVNKVLTRDALCGLMPLSWSRHVSDAVCYGTDKTTGIPVRYNRPLTKVSGFVLGSDQEYVQKRILAEIRQIREERPDIRIALYTIDAKACSVLADEYGTRTITYPLVTGIPDVDNEVLRTVTTIACGHNGDLAREKREAMERAIEATSGSFAAYVSNIRERNAHMGRQLSSLNGESSVFDDDGDGRPAVYQCGDPSMMYAERVGILIQALIFSQADMVYVLSAEAIAAYDAITMVRKKQKGAILTWSSLTANGDGLQKLYLGDQAAEEIKRARFLDISRHDTIDRVRLRAILDFSRKENGILASPDSGMGILVTDDTAYVYEDTDKKEEVEDNE